MLLAALALATLGCGDQDAEVVADNQGVTPLAHAEAQGFEEIAAILRAAGATS